MLDPKDILGRRDQIKNYVAEAEIEEGLKSLIAFVGDFYVKMEHEVILLSMDYHSLLREERMGIVKREDFKRNRRQIAYKILAILKEIMKKIKSMTIA